MCPAALVNWRSAKSRGLLCAELKAAAGTFIPMNNVYILLLHNAHRLQPIPGGTFFIYFYEENLLHKNG